MNAQNDLTPEQAEKLDAWIKDILENPPTDLPPMTEQQQKECDEFQERFALGSMGRKLREYESGEITLEEFNEYGAMFQQELGRIQWKRLLASSVSFPEFVVANYKRSNPGQDPLRSSKLIYKFQDMLSRMQPSAAKINAINDLASALSITTTETISIFCSKPEQTSQQPAQVVKGVRGMFDER